MALAIGPNPVCPASPSAFASGFGVLRRRPASSYHARVRRLVGDFGFAAAELHLSVVCARARSNRARNGAATGSSAVAISLCGRGVQAGRASASGPVSVVVDESGRNEVAAHVASSILLLYRDPGYLTGALYQAAKTDRGRISVGRLRDIPSAAGWRR